MSRRGRHQAKATDPSNDKTEYRMKDSQRAADLADEWVERQLARDARLRLSVGEVAHVKSIAAVLDALAECEDGS